MASLAAQSAQRLGLLATIGLVAASAGFGLLPLFARALTAEGMAPHAVVFFRYVVTATLLLPMLRVRRARLPAVLWGIASGIVLGLGWIGYVKAIEVVPVSTAGILYMTYPVFTLVIGWLFFAEAPSRRALMAALLVLAAAAVSTSPAAVTPAQIPALLLSLTAPLGFGFGINVLVHKLRPLPPLTRIAATSLGAVVGLSPLLLDTAPAALFPSTLHGWELVAGLALGTALVPRLLYAVCAPVVGTARTAAAGSVELLTMVFVGWGAFGERIGAAEWAACGLIIAAIVLTPSKVTRNVTTNITAPRKER